MEKNYNKIDDFFKKAFEQKKAFEEGWNVPSDEVWEKLSETGRERKRVFLYWKWAAIAAGMLLFFLVGQSIYQQKQLQQQAAKIEQLEQQLQKQEVQRLKNEIVEGDKKFETSKNNSSSSETAIVTELVKPKSRISRTPPNTSISSTVATPLEQAIVVAKDTSEIRILPSPPTSVPTEKIDAIASLTSDIDLLTTPASRLNMPKIIPEKIKSTSYLTANYALTESAQTFDHRRNQTFRRSNVIKEQNINLGLRYTHFLDNNWFVEGGAHYSKSTAERSHLLRSRFQKNNERPSSNGDFESTHNLSLSSSAYDLETDVVLTRSSSSNTILDGRNLRLIGIVTNEIQRLSVPVLVGHRLEYQKWNWMMKAGFAPTITLLDEVRLDRVLSSEDEFEVQSITRTQRNPNTQPLSLYFYAGSSLSYRLNEALAIQIEPYFSRSLTAQRVSRNSAVFNHSTGVHLGLQYTL